MSTDSDLCTRSARPRDAARPAACAKQLEVGGRTLLIRGVTYGTFRPGPDGSLFPPREVVESDFAEMVRHGINTVRTYTTPPTWLLDLAQQHGLYVMAGISWTQHTTFLDVPGLT